MRAKVAVATGMLVAALGLTGGAALLSNAGAQPPPGAGAGGPPMGAPPGFGPGGSSGPAAGSGFGPVGPGGPGFPGGMPGGGFSGIAQPVWEYKFVDFKGDRKAFEQTVTANGRDGWEFCTSERFGEGNRTETVLVFKKPKGGVTFGGAGGGGGAARPITGGSGGDTGGGAPRPGSGGAGGGMRPAPGGPGVGGTSSGGGTRPAPGGMGPMVGPGAPGAGSFDRIGGAPTGGEALLSVIPLKYAQALELEPILKKATGATITAEPRTNQLIVRADEQTMKELQELVRTLDVQVAKPK